MNALMISVGNFFFRWRDTAFSLVILGGVVLVVMAPGVGLGGAEADWATSLAALVFALAGQLARAVTIGYAYIKRGGLNKQIFAETLVQRGMFAHTRNPLYLGNLLIVTAAVFAFNTVWYYAIALPFFYFIYACITVAEENFLRGKFGEAYDQFCRQVPNRFWPGNLGRFGESIKDMDFTFRRLIKKEHGTIFLVFSTLALVTVLKMHVRHGLPLNSTPALALWAVIGALVAFQIVAALSKRLGKLEWDPNRP